MRLYNRATLEEADRLVRTMRRERIAMVAIYCALIVTMGAVAVGLAHGVLP